MDINSANNFFVNVDEDGQFFTTLEQIHNCLTLSDKEDQYRALAIKAIVNTINKGYKIVDKNNSDWNLTGLKIRQKTIVPYQLCPKCFGTSKVMNNECWGNTTSISTGPVTCDVCNGAKIIPQAII